MADAAADARKKNQEEFDKMRADQAKMNAEVMAKQDACRPTPTVEEVQKALIGEHVDEKEPDGSPEQNVHHVTTPASKQIEVGHKVAEAKPAGGVYATRTATPEKPKV
jgi:hypothetical protein